MGYSNEFTAGSATPQLVFQAPEWVYVTAQLDSSAVGDNKLGYDAAGMAAVEPGSTVTLIMQPGTRIHVSTTAATARWSFFYTPLSFLTEIVYYLRYLAMGLPVERPDAGGFHPEAVRRFER